MLHEFLADNRADLVDRCRRKAAQRSAPKADAIEPGHGIPVFLEQLIGALRFQGRQGETSVPDSPGPEDPAFFDAVRNAALHGAELLQREFTIDQVVHDYGDLCQAITELAAERKAPIETVEFQVLNQSLDNAIADAVTEYSSRRAVLVAEDSARAENERMADFAHQLHDVLHDAILALAATKAGHAAVGGATGATLDRSMIRLQNLINCALAESRARAGAPAPRYSFGLADFILELKAAASAQARAYECSFSVGDVDPQLHVEADRVLLMAAADTLLEHAFKFSRSPGEVRLDARRSGDRILIDMSNNCGGLPPPRAEALFRPLAQAGVEGSRPGVLSVARRSVEASGGTLTVRAASPVRCVFTINLPASETDESPRRLPAQ
jgi:signal transduction histidine kinase